MMLSFFRNVFLSLAVTPLLVRSLLCNKFEIQLSRLMSNDVFNFGMDLYGYYERARSGFFNSPKITNGKEEWEFISYKKNDINHEQRIYWEDHEWVLSQTQTIPPSTTILMKGINWFDKDGPVPFMLPHTALCSGTWSVADETVCWDLYGSLPPCSIQIDDYPCSKLRIICLDLEFESELPQLNDTRTNRNFYFANENNRVVATKFEEVSYDISYSSIIEDEGRLEEPSDILFLDQYRFLVNSKNAILEYDVDGSFIGVFANISASGMKKHYGGIQVASDSGLFNFSLNGKSNNTIIPSDYESYFVDDVVGFEKHFRYVTAINQYELITVEDVIAFSGEDGISISTPSVVKHCLKKSECSGYHLQNIWFDEYLHEEIIDSGLLTLGEEIISIAILNDEDFIMVIKSTNSILKCKHSGGRNPLYRNNACETWYDGQDEEYGILGSIYFDRERRGDLVYVSSSKGILVFGMEGGEVMKKVGRAGDLCMPRGFTIRPGLHPPLSSVEPVPKATAGEEFACNLIFHDEHDEPLDNSAHPEIDRFTVLATLQSTETNEIPPSVPGNVEKIGSNFKVKLNLKLSGDWTISVVEGTKKGVRNPLVNSPFRTIVRPGPTDIRRSELNLIEKGTDSSTYEVVLKDMYGNLIDHQDDKVEYNFIGEVYDVDTSRKITIKTTSFFEDLRVLSVSINKKESKELNLEAAIVISGASRTLVFGLPAFILFFIAIVYSLFVCSRRWKKIAANIEEEKERKEEIFRHKEESYRKNENRLQEKLAQKEHSLEELEVMRVAIEELKRDKDNPNKLEEVIIDSSCIQIASVLGKGGFGTVHLGTYTDDKKNMTTKVAIKQLLEINNESVKRFQFECFLLKNIRHPNIVELVGVCWDKMLLACLLEFVSGGTLQDRLDADNKVEGSLLSNENAMRWRGERGVLKIMTEAALGVQYLHQSRFYNHQEKNWENCIIHRDLKPDNMLLTSDWVLKLTDFGEARAIDPENTMTQVGTPIYVAPEILKSGRFNEKVDSYSFAICLVSCLRCEEGIVKFFQQGLRRSMKKKSTAGIGLALLNNRMINRKWRPSLPNNLYRSLRRLIEDCWDDDPDRRPDFDQIVSRLGGDIRTEVDFMIEPEFTRDWKKSTNNDADYDLDGEDDTKKNNESDTIDAAEEIEKMRSEILSLKRLVSNLTDTRATSDETSLNGMDSTTRDALQPSSSPVTTTDRDQDRDSAHLSATTTATTTATYAHDTVVGEENNVDQETAKMQMPAAFMSLLANR